MPVRRTNLVIEAESKDEFESGDELVIESGIRSSTRLGRAEVIISENTRSPGEFVLIELNDDRLELDDLTEVGKIILNTYPSMSRGDINITLRPVRLKSLNFGVFTSNNLLIHLLPDINLREVGRGTRDEIMFDMEERLRRGFGYTVDVKIQGRILTAVVNSTSMTVTQALSSKAEMAGVVNKHSDLRPDPTRKEKVPHAWIEPA